jgi:hypothetical protein
VIKFVSDLWHGAATVPVVYTTAFYALVVRGRIKRGDRVLIHSGSGGVGQAAISIALHHGCEVFTTVACSFINSGNVTMFLISGTELPYNCGQRSPLICFNIMMYIIE